MLGNRFAQACNLSKGIYFFGNKGLDDAISEANPQ